MLTFTNINLYLQIHVYQNLHDMQCVLINSAHHWPRRTKYIVKRVNNTFTW